MLSPLMILILAGLTVGAILLVSVFLVFSDGAKVYKHPEMSDYHSKAFERGKNNIYVRLQSQDE